MLLVLHDSCNEIFYGAYKSCKTTSETRIFLLSD